MRSVVGAPIQVAGRLWGALMATSELPHAFPADTEERVSNFAELVTAALANADAREQLAASRVRIVEAADAARRRIERDLHDGAQQRLVSLALSLRLLETRLEPESAACASSRSCAPSSMPRWRSSASSLAGSIRASSPIAAWRPRLPRWPAARRCRSSSTWTAAGASVVGADDRLLRRRRSAHQRLQARPVRAGGGARRGGRRTRDGRGARRRQRRRRPRAGLGTDRARRPCQRTRRHARDRQPGRRGHHDPRADTAGSAG